MNQTAYEADTSYIFYTVFTLVLSGLLICLFISLIVSYTFKPTDEDALLTEAIEWQLETKGVLSMPLPIASRYKELYSEIYIHKKKINNLILGSSTVMGIRDYMFPEEKLTFNFAKSSNPLFKTISEAKYFINKYDHIKWVYIGIDWGLAFPYLKNEVTEYKPAPIKISNIRLWRKIKDAVSYQRVKTVLSYFKQYLLANGHNDHCYACPKENNIGMDIQIPRAPKICDGFRYDGSATFAFFNGLSLIDWVNFLNGPLKKYSASLTLSNGQLNRNYLNHLLEIDRILKTRKGKLIMFIPPMMPKLVDELKQRKVGIYLNRTIDELSAFTSEHGINLINASKSECFNCAPEEFLDPHHAFDSCYSKIFNSF